MNFREPLGTDELEDDLAYALYLLQEVLRHSMQIAESLTFKICFYTLGVRVVAF